jgi:hypothetical protein
VLRGTGQAVSVGLSREDILELARTARSPGCACRHRVRVHDAARPTSEIHTLARARTATILSTVDAIHNRSVIHFLTEARLTGTGDSSISLLKDLELVQAERNGAPLTGADLRNTTFLERDLAREQPVRGTADDGGDRGDEPRDLRKPRLCVCGGGHGFLLTMCKAHLIKLDKRALRLLCARVSVCAPLCARGGAVARGHGDYVQIAH